MTEAELSMSLRRCAREQGWLEHLTYDSRRSPKGWPDLTFGKGLWLVVWELKADGGRITKEQTAWLDWWSEFASGVEGVRELALADDEGPRVHVALIRPADLDAAYWLLMGQAPREGHPWPAMWPFSDRVAA